MYLHIGKDIILEIRNVIGIFNIESVIKTKEYQDIIEKLTEQKRLVDFSEGIKKSLVLICENDKLKGYISNISSLTLCNRVQ